MRMNKLFGKAICVLIGGAMLTGTASAEYSVLSTDVYSDSAFYLAGAGSTVSAEWNGTVAASFDGGTGTEADPYLIANGEQLALLAQYVNSKDADYVFAYYTLTADILLNDDINSEPTQWTSIGTRDDDMSASAERPFRGTFDGANHKVIGLYQTGNYAYGLFSCISESAAVKNLSVTDGKIEPRKIGVGAICGLNEGTIINCTNEVDIAIQREESVQIGGICGVNSGGTIDNCRNNGKVYIVYESTQATGYIGGVCGDLHGGTISNCVNEGVVTGHYYTGGICGTASAGPAGEPAGSLIKCSNTAKVSAKAYIGGVCGYSTVPVSECFNTGEVIGEYYYIGGVCGSHDGGTIKDSYNTGDITGCGQYIGGICGYFANNNAVEDILRCYNTGNISNTLQTSYDSGGYTGGICGQFSGNMVSQCYNTGNVTANDTFYAGGICGKCAQSGRDFPAKISECYNSGSVTSSNDRVGGIAGYTYGSEITDCYNIGAVKGKQYVGGLWGKTDGAPVANCYNAGKVTATGTSARNPYLFPAGENKGEISNVFYNSDVNVDIYNQNPAWGKSVAQLTADTVLSDLGFDTEKWSKTANTSEYLYYPDLKYFENDNPAYSASTPVPTGLSASAEFYSITLSWDEFSGATMYAVYYSTDDSRYELASDTVTETNYTLTELESGKKYYFKISAYVSDEWTGCSKTIDVDTDSYYVRAHSLTLGDDIGVKFYIKIADNIIADESSYVKFTVNGRESTLYVKDVNYHSYYGYEFICPVAAAEMNDTITGQLYVGGQAVGDEFTYSVKTYADYILENSAEYPDEVPLVNAMLNYGAAAEKYFRGSTELEFTKPVVDASLLAAYKFTVNDNDAAYSFVGQVISLENKVTAKLYFSGGNLTVGNFRVTQNGDAVEASRLTVGSDTKGTYLAISGISANEMSAPFEISVGGVTISNYSVFSYVQGAINSSTDGLADVVSALYAYGCAAENYSKI